MDASKPLDPLEQAVTDYLMFGHTAKLNAIEKLLPDLSTVVRILNSDVITLAPDQRYVPPLAVRLSNFVRVYTPPSLYMLLRVWDSIYIRSYVDFKQWADDGGIIDQHFQREHPKVHQRIDYVGVQLNG